MPRVVAALCELATLAATTNVQRIAVASSLPLPSVTEWLCKELTYGWVKMSASVDTI